MLRGSGTEQAGPAALVVVTVGFQVDQAETAPRERVPLAFEQRIAIRMQHGVGAFAFAEDCVPADLSVLHIGFEVIGVITGPAQEPRFCEKTVMIVAAAQQNVPAGVAPHGRKPARTVALAGIDQRRPAVVVISAEQVSQVVGDAHRLAVHTIDHQHDAELIVRFGVEIKQCTAVVVFAFVPDLALVRCVLDTKAVGWIAVHGGPQAPRVVEQGALQQTVGESREIDDVGFPAAARQFPRGIAGQSALQNMAALVESGAPARGLAQRGHAKRDSDRVVDPARIVLPGPAFDSRTEQTVTECRVLVMCAGRKAERLVAENRNRLACVVGPGGLPVTRVGGRRVLRAVFPVGVVNDARAVCQQVPDANVALVAVDGPVAHMLGDPVVQTEGGVDLRESQRGSGGQRFGNRTPAKNGVGRDRYGACEVGMPVAPGVVDFAVANDTHSHADDVLPGHFIEHDRIDPGGGLCVLCSTGRRCDQQGCQCR